MQWRCQVIAAPWSIFQGAGKLARLKQELAGVSNGRSLDCALRGIENFEARESPPRRKLRSVGRNPASPHRRGESALQLSICFASG